MRVIQLFFLALWSSVVQAEPDNILDTIIVTGSRTPVSIGELGASATVLDRAYIEKRQSALVADLLRGVPGFSVSRSGGVGRQTQLRVRGAEGNQVMVLIDGVEANDMAGNDEFDFGNLTTAEIDRIEIVRGPQSALWGSDALAGVINIITRKGDAGYDAQLTLDAGSFATTQQRAHFGYRGKSKRFRIGIGRIDTGGTNISRAGDEDDAFHSTNLSMSGAVAPRDDFELSFTARTLDNRTQTDSGAFTGLPVDTPGVTKSNQTYLGTQAQWTTLDGRWIHRANGNWTSTEIDSRDPAVFSEGSTSGDRYEASLQTTLSYELDFGLHTMHRSTLAVDHEYQRFKQRGPVTFFGDPNQNRGMHNTGYVGEHRIDFGGGFNLGASLRHDDNTSFRDITTYRVSGSWLVPFVGTTLTGAYGTGQKAPTFIERFGFSSGGAFGLTFVGNGDLEPEKSRGWEVGLSRGFADERLRMTAAWFNERLRKEINGFQVDSSGATATAVNLPGTSRRQGLEVSIVAAPGHNVDLTASYTYLDANEVDSVSGLRVDEVRRPNHQGSVSIDWTGYDDRLHLGLLLTHSGSFEDITFLPPSFQSQRVAMESFSLLNLSARFSLNRNFELFARVENALDDQYEEVFGFEAAGVAAYAGIRIKFLDGLNE